MTKTITKFPKEMRMSDKSDTPARPLLNLSRFQYGDLKWIAEHRVTMAHLRRANATTLTSLAYRGYLRRIGTGEDAEVLLTASGEEALRTYKEASLNERQREQDLTERCQRLLKHSRKVVTLAS